MCEASSIKGQTNRGENFSTMISMGIQLLALMSSIKMGISIHINGKEGVECYDCNYSPSGDVRGRYGWISSEQAGYPKCALSTKDDTYRVDKISCSSGACFIRMDQNGLLYRGCADYSYLPWTVDVRQQCRYQGPFNSLWWFCNSTLCNDGLIDTRDRCASRAPDSLQVVDTTKILNGGLSARNGKELEPGTLEDNTGSRIYVDDPVGILERELSRGPVGKGSRNQQSVEEFDQQRIEQNRRDGARNIKENPCDGTCRENSSGLFAHPNSSSYFIHCGHGNINGLRCFCCQPFVVMCPPNTIFDDTYKICRRVPY